ncbi:glycosyltransferase family 4 protein [Patescibacteria group bacterium]|nr:glycosyltransferase family 4 protein [Patescibacteria group bacterium]
MKKLLIIGPRAFPADFVGTSGVETYVYSAVSALVQAEKELEVTVLTRTTYQEQVVSSTPLERVQVRGLIALPGKILEAVSYSLMASIIAAFSKADVVWYHTAGMAIGAWIPALFGKKIWVTIHSLDWQRKKWGRTERLSFRISSEFIMRVVRNGELFAVTEALAEKIRQISKRECHVAYPGIPHPPHLDHHMKRQDYLLYLGRLVPEKRVEWLLEFSATQGVPCLIVGTHGNTPDYEKKLRQQYQSKYVNWYGSAIGQEKWEVLAQAKYLVLPSELEGFPITILEAVAMRTPSLLAHGILPSDFASLPLIETFEASSQEDFNRVLKQLLHKRAKRRPFSTNDRRVLRRYTWQRTASSYTAFL